MVKYICTKCGKEFTHKGMYTKHSNRKKPCSTSSEEEVVQSPVETKTEPTNTKDATVVREEGLDKFYTIPSYSKKCIDKVGELYDVLKWWNIISTNQTIGDLKTMNNNQKLILIQVGSSSYYINADSSKIGVKEFLSNKGNALIGHTFSTNTVTLKNIDWIRNPMHQ